MRKIAPDDLRKPFEESKTIKTPYVGNNGVSIVRKLFQENKNGKYAGSNKALMKNTLAL